MDNNTTVLSYLFMEPTNLISPNTARMQTNKNFFKSLKGDVEEFLSIYIHLYTRGRGKKQKLIILFICLLISDDRPHIHAW